MSESHDDLWLERTTYVGGFLEAFLYGIQIVVYFMCIKYLLDDRKDKTIRWRQLIYITILFGSGTINVAANTNYRQLAWIEDRDTFPGGPAAFIQTQWYIPVSVASNASFSIGNILADGLMLWRCFLVWSPVRWVMIVPTLAYLATSTLSILTIYQISQPGSNLDDAINLAVPYFALSMSTNLVLSLMIAGRVLAMRQQVVEVLGEEHARPYTSVISIVIESAALYSVVSLAFLIAYVKNSPAQNVLIDMLTQVMCIASELIILRVAYGRAWSRQVLSRGLPVAHGHVSSRLSHIGIPTQSHLSDERMGRSQSHGVIELRSVNSSRSESDNKPYGKHAEV